MRGSAALAALLLAAPALAFDVALPVACRLGDTCHIQNFFDHDAGPGTADFACGPLTYDGHDGTDVAVATLADMARGAVVVAPADGTVRAIRDGMPDIAVDDPAAPPLDGRDCGNGVAIDHGQGWETQLCHLKQGSVIVTEGERVTRGQPLGQIGLSGNTVFPHVHMTLRRDGQPVDPFAPAASTACSTAQPGLWAGPVAYDPFGFLDTGWAGAIPEYAAITAGLPDAAIAADSAALVIWAFYFGSRTGDVMTFRVTGPDGPFLDETVTLDRTQARGFRAVGKRNRGVLAAGDWQAVITLTRDGQVIETTQTAIRVDG